MDIRKINKVVIIGAGQSGGIFALSLRQEGFQGDILVIGEEQHLPYERPQLSKEVLLGDEDKIKFIRNHDEYEKLNILFKLNKKVVELDVEANNLVLNDSTIVDYDVLVIATGVKARQLPQYQKENCLSIRTIEDAYKIKSQLTAEKKILVVGGGVIGLEVANAAIHKGCSVNIVEISDQLMNRSLDKDVSKIIQNFHENNGIQFHFNTSIQELDNNYVKLSNNVSLDPDLIILGVGVEANNDFLKNTKIFCEAGVQVNEYCQTDINNIFAIGDIAIQNVNEQENIRLETWQNAQNQALKLAKYLTKSEITQTEPAWFWSDQGSLNIQVIGDVKSTNKILRKIDEFKLTYLYTNELNELIGCVTINNPKDMSIARKFVGRNKVIDVTKVLDTKENLKSCFIG